MEKKFNQPKVDIKAYYRNTFASLEGQKVLADILEHGNFFNDIETDEDRVRHNFSKYILNMCGGMDVRIKGIHQ